MVRVWQACLCLVVAAGMGAAGWAASGPVVCPRVAVPPTLDGRLDDWPPLPQVVIASAEAWHPASAEFADYGGPEDVSAEVHLAWDERALYLALQVADDVFVRVPSAAEIDRGDSIVLTVAGAEGEHLDQFVIARLRRGLLVYRSEPAARAGEVRRINLGMWAPPVEEGPQRVTYEVAIPWAELTSVRPAPGMEFTLTVSICDDDGEGLKGVLEEAARVALSPSPPPAARPPGVRPTRLPVLAPVFAAPQTARFDAKSFVFHGRETLLFAGLVDYARLAPEQWDDRLALLRAAGMNAVAVTAPWSHHQPTREEPLLDDLAAFLDRCQELGLLVKLNVGPFAGEEWEAGGMPRWAAALGPAGRQEAAERWARAALALAAGRQLTAGGPVVAVTLRPWPDEAGRVGAEALERLVALAVEAGVEVPLLTGNAPAARENTSQPLANLLDTVSFYQPTDVQAVLAAVAGLGREENGPAVLSGLRAGEATAEGVLRSAGRLKAALGAGAGAVVVSDFAPGDGGPREAVVDAAGAVGLGYGELRLVGAFVREFGERLARSVAAPGAVKADSPEVEAMVRLSSRADFITICERSGRSPRQVRLRYTEPGAEGELAIPQAGAISLRPGETKILALNVPLGPGTLRYSTSEVVALHEAGDRTMLVVHGEPDTFGEIALQWPGPPLVVGRVIREHWDPDANTLVLNYLHSAQDQYLLVDNLQIAILSRARAAHAVQAEGDGGRVTISAGARVEDAWSQAGGVAAVLQCPPGAVEVTAALPAAPTSVMVDGEPVEFDFATPERVVRFTVETPTFEQERAPGSVWGRLRRAVSGAAPALELEFDRGHFMPEAAAEAGGWGMAGETSGFVRQRARFRRGEVERVEVRGGGGPRLVFVNGVLVAEMSGAAGEATAQVGELLEEGENEVLVVTHLLPRAPGAPGIKDGAGLPEVRLLGPGGEEVAAEWEMSDRLAGEELGWQGAQVDVRGWHFVRLGAWREQGRRLAEVAGIGWYRVPFEVPSAGDWRIPYRLQIRVRGAGELYLNGARLATLAASGEHAVPLPAPPLRKGEPSVLAAALYGPGSDTGLYRAVVSADREHMTRRRRVEIRY